MKQAHKIVFRSIAVILITAMLFSCINDSNKVRDFLAEKNLPIAVAKDAYHVYKDSGRVTSKLMTPYLNDFSNRKNHPYKEFPKGIKIINFENNGKDSLTIIGDYSLSYVKTSISEIRGNVVIINHTDQSRLETEQLFWDRRNKYFFTEKSFVLTRSDDTIVGVGFESMENLDKYVAKQTNGNIIANENEI